MRMYKNTIQINKPSKARSHYNYIYEKYLFISINTLFSIGILHYSKS